MTQKNIIPAKEMTITTTGGLVPRMEIKVTCPAFKAPRESHGSNLAKQNQKEGRAVEQGDVQHKD